MAMRKRSLKTSFEITGPDALFHMMSIRFRSDTIYVEQALTSMCSISVQLNFFIKALQQM